MAKDFILEDELIQKIADVHKDSLLKKIEECLRELGTYLVQIYRIENSKPLQVGSGFYLRYLSRIFFISAAHVFDDEPSNQRFIFDDAGDFVPITGKVHKHIAEGDRDDDLKDVIAIEVSSATRSNILDSSMLCLHSDFQSGLYAFMGYPGTKNKVNPAKQVFKNRPYSYYDFSLRSSEIKSFAYDDSLNILIRYQHKKTMTLNDGPNKAPRMKGISGGPVFLLLATKKLLEWDRDQVKLVGIVIHSLEREEYMAAASLKILTDYLGGDEKLTKEFETFQLV